MSRAPLLDMMAGRSVRLRRGPRLRPKEILLQTSVASLLTKHGHPDWQWTHIASGELRDAKTAAKLQRMGLRAGWPDIALISPVGLFHALELKRIGGSLNEAQKEFAAWCQRHGVPHGIAHDLDEAVRILSSWGALRLRIAGYAPDNPEPVGKFEDIPAAAGGAW